MLLTNASSLELSWTGVAVAGLLFSLVFLGYLLRSYQAVEGWIERGLAYRWGPRHKFVLGFLLGIGLLAIVWVGFILLGGNAILNPPPPDPIREVSSERAGWILVILESFLFLVQTALLFAWVVVAHPSLQPTPEKSPMELVLEATDAGREMGHAVANALQRPIALFDLLLHDEHLTPAMKSQIEEALKDLESVLTHSQVLHLRIKALAEKL